MKTFLLLLLATTSATAASPKYPQVPPAFINEWCRSPETDYEKTIGYQTPSWHENSGECKDILVIDSVQIYSAAEDIYCFPLTVRERAQGGHTGTSYSATITCDTSLVAPSNGSPGAKAIKLERYKGNLSLEKIK